MKIEDINEKNAHEVKNQFEPNENPLFATVTVETSYTVDFCEESARRKKTKFNCAGCIYYYADRSLKDGADEVEKLVAVEGQYGFARHKIEKKEVNEQFNGNEWKGKVWVLTKIHGDKKMGIYSTMKEAIEESADILRMVILAVSIRDKAK